MAADPNTLHPSLRPWCSWLSSAIGAEITSTYRSRSEQTRLYRTRQRVLSGELPESEQPFPVAPPGTSYHEYGRAFDLKAPIDRLIAAGRYWRSIGGTWDPSDPIHFQA